ncbi:Luciferase-like monooxygenase superfamily protein [Candidatus Pelagibacter sp. HTCC7211]|uniref:LLM class flavin-dependent oxidoreductase n=1 Tax=Pelagibacter sp. (strain HTCC7211) TaxID=439493 RepID=UPI000183ACBA|nr:LLM class flavin-dependent oxidoreductase [Candidatus Pelagibacter sp. HTCC7211]EDZ60737.1 Luciferase-like monooxygenase superfamily protein [Candidatus Pelagibacter sp. HTCC7211]MBD1151251.1 LLM class flavin-dependent oxidoreductase [Pelagibacterales bacterium SAG-MED25]MDC3158682.1 LLM class flavin-dependent oxidoreductase [Candidatus Pelagibacter sp.]
MDFNHFLTSYMPNPNVGSKVHFQNMIEQSILAEKLGYKKVSIPEHHLINLLMMPSPLQMAVKIASLTKNISISTSVAVLPLHDMRTYAGEVATADILTDGRLILGVARGAFPWEMKRLGTPIEHSKEKFTESLEVLQKLLSEEEVSFSGKYYNFEALTIMPRPITQPIPIMIAAMDPKSIKNAALRGFHVQSTVLSGTRELLMERVNAFRDGCEELGEKGKLLKLSMQRMMFVAKDEKDAEIKNKLAYEYYKRFDNMFTGPGKVKNGNIIPLPRKQSFEEMKDNLLICPINELIDKLSIYAEAGVDEFIISSSFGQEQNETIESMHKISEEIIPYFKNSKNQVA